jgi:hypothetical protein
MRHRSAVVVSSSLSEVVQEGCLLRERRRVHYDEESYVVVHCELGAWVACYQVSDSNHRRIFLHRDARFAAIDATRYQGKPTSKETEGSTCGVQGETVCDSIYTLC